MEYINLVVGAGVSGATLARKLAEEKNQKIVVIDTKSHIGGNCYDYRDENGIMIHKYGSHIFHTSDEIVWSFVRRFTDFNQYMHKVVAVIDGIETTIPFNFNTLYDVFPKSLSRRLEEKLLNHFSYNKKIPILEFQKQNDADLKFLAEYIYEKVFLHYTAKQWGAKPNDVAGIVTARVPVYLSKDNRYFQDKYQGIPLEGYTKMIENMLNHPNIDVRLGIDYKTITEHFDQIFYTGAIDEFFEYEFGQLPYRSVYFKFEEYDCEFYQKNSVVNYPCNYDFTRIHEYKHYLNDKSAKTVIAKEYSEFFEPGKNERYYPIPNEKTEKLYARYSEKAKFLPNIHFLGRLGDYKYYDMDKAIKRALELFESL